MYINLSESNFPHYFTRLTSLRPSQLLKRLN